VVGEDGRLCHSNPQTAARLGYSLTRLTTMSWLQLLHAASRLVGYDSWQRVQKSRQSEAVSLNLLAADGTIVAVQGYADSDTQGKTRQVRYCLHWVNPDPNGVSPPAAMAVPPPISNGMANPLNVPPVPSSPFAQRSQREIAASLATLEDQTELVTRSLPDTTLMAVNAAYCRTLGKSEAELLGQPFLDLMSVSEQPKVAAALGSLSPDQPVVYTEHQICLANGDLAYFQWSNRGRFDPQGRLYEIQSVGRNIQPYKQIQQQLQQSESAFRQLFDAAAIGLAQTTIGEGRYLRVNRKLCEMLGYSEAELLGITYQEITHPDDLPACATYVQALLAGNIRSHPIQKRFLRKDGTIVWCNTLVSFLYDAAGHPIYAIAALEDITEQKAIAEALQASQAALQQQTQILQAVLNSMSEGVMVVDTTGRLYLSNATARQLLQLLPNATGAGETITLRPDLEQYFYQADGQPCPTHAFPLQRAIRGEEVDNQEVYLALPTVHRESVEAKSGERLARPGQGIWLSFTACPLTPTAGGIHGSVIIFRDITRYKQVEAEILNALAQEKHLGELRSRFLSLTSHEFRNPLTTIVAATELLQHYEWSREEQLAELALIQSKAQHLASLLEDTLLIDQAEMGQLRLRPEPLDLRVLCEQEIRSLERQRGSLVPITLQGVPDFPSPIWADKKLIQQMLSNLIGNALKYSPQEQPIQVSYRQEADQVVLQVTDHGIGIPLKDQPHLFEFFYRASNVGTIAGTGLGLAIVQKCVALHGGSITLTSEVGVGTTVIVKFPLRLSESG